MRNHSTRTTHRRRSFRRSDRGLRLTVALAVAGIAAIPLVGLIPFAGASPVAPSSPAVTFVSCSVVGCPTTGLHDTYSCIYQADGWCKATQPAVPASKLPLRDDPGANI